MNNDDENLSKGALMKILKREDIETPTIKVLAIRKMKSESIERYRLLLFDGECKLSCCVLGVNLNHLVRDGKLKQHTIIQLKDFYVQETKLRFKHILIITKLDIWSENINGHFSSLVIDDDRKSANSVKNEQNNFYAAFNSENRQQQYEELITYVSISDLLSEMKKRGNKSQYFKNTIRVRAIHKSEKRFRNKSWFNVVLQDDSCSINAVSFGKACENFFDIIRNDMVYLITNLNIKCIKPEFQIDGNEFEMILSEYTTVVPMVEVNVSTDKEIINETSSSDVPKSDFYDKENLHRYTFSNDNEDTRNFKSLCSIMVFIILIVAIYYASAMKTHYYLKRR